jgi:disulfide bond formation protein DsbB
MDMITVIVGGALVLLISGFILRLCYSIFINLVNGRKFHHSLDQEFNKLRLSNMLSSLGINKTAYIYQTSVNTIHQHMKNCSDCTNTGECDEKLSTADADITEIEFCNNEAELKEIKQRQSEQIELAPKHT